MSNKELLTKQVGSERTTIPRDLGVEKKVTVTLAVTEEDARRWVQNCGSPLAKLSLAVFCSTCLTDQECEILFDGLPPDCREDAENLLQRLVDTVKRNPKADEEWQWPK